jgi:hypothetical protein
MTHRCKAPSRIVPELNTTSRVRLPCRCITYLDADLFFFASPVPLFEELGTGSIAIIDHRFSPHLRHLETRGIYNVGWLSFRRDENALTCLRWWRERCLEWCYDRVEDGRFADQKYLDDWPSRFRNVVVLEHKGANLALWNVSNYRLSSLQGNTVMVANQPLIFFHVHGLQKIREWFYNPNWEMYDVVPSMVLRRKIYAYYIKVLFDTRCLVPLSISHPIANGIRKPAPVEDVSRISSIQRLVRRCRTRAILGQGLLKGKYFCVIHGYVI